MIDIHRFSATRDIRDYLNSPWVDSGKTIATNGHILIVLDTELPNLPSQEKQHPNWQEILDTYKSNTIELPVTLPPDIEPKKCSTCRGTGRASMCDCSACDGEGSFFHHGYEYDCQSCDGDGEVAQYLGDESKELCPHCDGSGFDWRPNPVAIEVPDLRIGIDYRYLHAVSQLPGIRMFGRAPMEGIYLTFDGGQGVVMPISLPDR